MGFDFPFKYVADWYDFQCEFVNKMNLKENAEKLYFEDTVSVFEVILYKNKKRISKTATMRLYGEKITVCDEKTSLVFDFESIKGITVLGKNKLNIY